MRTDLLETRLPKSMRVNDRIQNFVFFNVSNESEYSESEFFYPGEVSSTELLQSPSYTETEHRKKATLLTNTEARKAFTDRS